MTTSASNPAASNKGKTSAAFPTTPTDNARPSRAAAEHRRTPSSTESARSSRYPSATRRSTRAGSTSTHSATPPFMVTASGWAPPIPPSPPVSTTRPRNDPPKWASATAANVWNVPCRIPCVPM